MIKSKAQMQIESAKTNILKSCLNLLDISVSRIQRQKSGCFVPKLGACYSDGVKRDSINMLLKERIAFRAYQTISSEEMRRYVRKIAQAHSVNIDAPIARGIFIDFLQKLQDAHDEAFDEYHSPNIPNRMEAFVDSCNKIKEQLTTGIEK
jgi:hypothetical protein